MILLHLIKEFLTIGSLAIGGGMTVIPFLQNIVLTRGWITESQIIDMIMISEITPGPIAVKMAAFVGFSAAGIPGVAVASFALIVPQILIVSFIYKTLAKFKENKHVQNLLEGIRPTALALIIGAALTIFGSIFLISENVPDVLNGTDVLSGPDVIGGSDVLSWLNVLNWQNILLGAFFIVIILKWKIHPIALLAAGGIAGAVLGL